MKTLSEILLTKVVLSSAGRPNLSLTMYPFSIPTDEHVTLKFLMTKYFIIINHRYV